MNLHSCLVLFLLCFLNVSTITSTNPYEEEPVLFGGNFSALYVIGDSLVDSGNNNYLETLVKANFPPYGSNFEGGKATGRFSDGKTIADYIAIYYELPLVPAYLGLSEAQKNKITTGINYASASCGILPETGKRAGKCLSLDVQVNMFNETIQKNLKKKFKTQSELTHHLAKSLFMIAIGVNDFSYNQKTNAITFTNMLLREYLTQLERLYKLGARKFFINNIKPLGCYPEIIAKTVPRGSCNETLNLAITKYNVKLRASLSHMYHRLSKTSFLYSNYFSFMLGIRGPSSNQASSNLLNSTSPCCPKVYGGSSKTCGQGSIACKVPESYIFFDPFHPTQMANFMYAVQCFQERRICHVVRH